MKPSGNVAPTSVATYRDESFQDRLTGRIAAIHKILRDNHAGLTLNEIARYFGCAPSSCTAALNKLRDMGKITDEDGRGFTNVRRCSVTGNQCKVWRLDPRTYPEQQSLWRTA